MNRVIISQRIDHIDSRNEFRDSLDQKMIKWVLSQGFLPYPVPNLDRCETQLIEWVKHIDPSAIVLSGGNDIGEYPVRDSLEFFLINYAVEHKLPLLGICRGMQLISIWAGTKIFPVSNHANTVHEIDGDIQGLVNSYHNFGVKECPKDFKILAKSKDGLIEAIKHTSLPIEAWMWHPERNSNFSDLDQIRFKTLIDG